ncbi:response regulator transcription factor [bacterium]|nr:response regulator transcription factor [bacterium]
MGRKMKIMIVEDDPIIAEDLQAYMSEFGYEGLNPVSDANSALKLFKSEDPDLCLLDVHLGSEIDGIQLANMISDLKRVPIVFLTAFNDRDTIDRIKATGASAYLVKPVDERNLQTSIELAISNFYSKKKDAAKEQKEEQHIDRIFIKIKDRLTRFDLEDILYFEAYDNYAFIYTNKDKHILSASLKQVEEKLPSDQFVRTHRSYIVNINKIDGVGTSHVLLGKQEIPIGKTYRDDLMKYIDQL